MAEPAMKFERQMGRIQGAAPHEPIAIRRFELPDLHEHGDWMTERLLHVYPNVTQQTLFGWLNSILYSNDYLFLYQKNAVCLAQTLRGITIAPQPVVHERFTFVRDPKDASLVEAAIAFYADILRWARSQSAETVVFSDVSDVPPEKAKDVFGGRIFDKSYKFAKVAPR